jgi:predicted dehydrogenase
MSLWGEEGRIVLDPDARVYTLKPIGGIRTTRWHSFGRLPAVPIRAVYLSRLATSVSRGGAPEVTAEDGVAVQAAIEAIYRSAEQQTPAEAGPVGSGRSRPQVGVA